MIVSAVSDAKKEATIGDLKVVKKEGVDYLAAQPCWASKEEVSSIAEQIAKSLNFAIGGDLFQIVKRLGGTIAYAPLHLWKDVADRADGAIWVHARRDFTVLLSTLTAPVRDRFTIAHELGHYFLHSIQGEMSIVADRGASKRVEWEANWFAAAFLMPVKQFQENWDSLPALERTACLSKIFNVSTAAVRIRAIALGLDP